LAEALTPEVSRNLVVNSELLVTDPSSKCEILEITITESRVYMLACMYSFLQSYREHTYDASQLENELIDVVWRRIQDFKTSIMMDVEELCAVCMAIDLCARSMLEGNDKGRFSTDEMRFFAAASSMVNGYKGIIRELQT